MDRKEESSSSVDSWEETAVLIAQEIREWSARIVEVPCPAFGNMPPCPFARQAWLNESVMVHVSPNLDSIIEIKAVFPPTDNLLHVFAITDTENFTPEDLVDWIDEQNDQHFGVWIMGFHPDSAEDPLTPEYEGLGADDYAIVLVQSLSHLVEASEQLRKSNYYDNFPPEDMAYINHRKEIYDAWNEKVDAKAFNYNQAHCAEEGDH